MEYISLDKKLAVENYDSSFKLLSLENVPMELTMFGGFYSGKQYNFLIFGQPNPAETDSCEVIRVVKYSKDWQRLGQASLYGGNTKVPFDAGSVRCTEYNGMLYIHTAHLMYKSRGNANHQANMFLVVRQSDMEITDSQYGIESSSYGYVSHSFAQYVTVDPAGRVVTLNQGDMFPRAAAVSRYELPAGGDELITYHTEMGLTFKFTTSPLGAFMGGFEASDAGYLTALVSLPQDQNTAKYQTYNVILSFLSKDFDPNASGEVGISNQITQYPEGAENSVRNVKLVKISSNRFLLLWDITKKTKGLYTNIGQIGYAFVDGTGKLQGTVQTAQACLSDNQPILSGNRVVWYYTANSEPTFCSLDLSSGTVTSVGGGGGRKRPVNTPTVPSAPVLPSVTTEPVTETDTTPQETTGTGSVSETASTITPDPETKSETVSTPEPKVGTSSDVQTPTETATKTDPKMEHTTSPTEKGNNSSAAQTKTDASQPEKKSSSSDRAKSTETRTATSGKKKETSSQEKSNQESVKRTETSKTTTKQTDAEQEQPLVFADVTTQWFKPHIDKATAAKLMFGTGSGKFDPQGNLTIAQAMTLAYQIHSKATGGTLPKTSGAWYMPYYQLSLIHI